MKTQIKNISNLFKSIHTKISSSDFLEKYRLQDNYFLRKRKMSFQDYIQFILGLPKKSLPTELDSFFTNHMETGTLPISKQAFSRQRQHISPKAFRDLFLYSNDYISNHTKQKTWHGHRLLAVDGTTIQLPSTTENYNYFGGHTNEKGDAFPIAQANSLFDVLNDTFIDADISCYTFPERYSAKLFIDRFSHQGFDKPPVILFDRGYPSKDLIRSLMEKNLYYMIRCTSRFVDEVVNAPQGDYFVRHNDKRYHHFPFLFRVIKFTLPSGVEEILITNLYGAEYTTEELKELYFFRWGIESKYDEIKNRLSIENFTGKKPGTIIQDFYATLLFANLVSSVKHISDALIANIERLKELKHEYQTNRNFMIGQISTHLFDLISSTHKRRKLIEMILEKCVRQRSMSTEASDT